MKYIFTLALASGFFLGLPQIPSRAQILTTEEIVQQLVPVSRTRSLKPARGITVEGTQTADTGPSVNLYINFEFNSAALKQDALITLDRLAAAMKDQRLAGLDFLIGGHTDAVGSDQYNDRLSAARALSVKRYLAENSGIEAHRLVDKGFGESRLLDPQHPLDGVNRRVQIITLATAPQ